MRPLSLPPFSAGHIFEVAAMLFGRGWRTMYVAAAIFLVPAYAVMDVAASNFAPRFYVWVGQAERTIPNGDPLPPLPHETPLMIGVLLVAVIVMLLAGAAAAATIIHLADTSYRERSGPLSASIAWAVTRLPALAGGMLIYYLIGGVIVIAALPTGWLLLLGGGFMAFLGLLVIVSGVAALALLGVRVSLLQQAIVLENLSPVAGFRRSWRLTTGSGWRVLGYTVLLAVLSGIVGTFVSSIPVAALNLHPEIPRDVAVSTLFDAAVDLIVAPLTPLIFTLLYYDLRWRAGEPPVPDPVLESVSQQQV